MNFEKKRDLLYLDIMDYMGTEFIDGGLIMSRDVNFRIVEQHDNFPEKYAEFVELYNKGVKTADILKKMGVGINRYRTLLKEAANNGDIVKRDKKTYYTGRPIKQLNDEVYSRFVEKYLDETYTIADIQKELNLTNWMFNRYRKKGVQEGIIEEDRQLMFRKQFLKKNYPKVVALRNQGVSVRRICKEVGLTERMVNTIRREAILKGDIVK